MAADAVKKNEPQGTIVQKMIQGTVSAINRQGVAVEFGHAQTGAVEMYLPFDKKLQVSGAKDVTDIHEKDTILVEYQELPMKDETTGKVIGSSRVAVKIGLLKRAPPPAPEPAEETPEEDKS